MTILTSTSFKKSLDIRAARLLTVAPNTFRMPISLVRCYFSASLR